MARSTQVSEQEIKIALRLRNNARNVRQLRKALSVILMDIHEMDADRTAEVLGISRRTVFRNRKEICSQEKAPRKSWGGRRNFILTPTEEEEFLNAFAKEAKAGELITVKRIHLALREKVGRDIPTSTTYRILERHNWRKVEPNTRHPRKDQARQDEFKKNFQKSWLPPN